MRKTNKQTIKIKCYNYVIGERKRRAIFERRRTRRKEEAEAEGFVAVFGLESVKTLGSEGPLTLHTPLSGSPGEGTSWRGLGGCGELQSPWVEP